MGHPVRNIHRRTVPAPESEVGSLLDWLASQADRLWPHEHWPRMRFDRPLQAGAAGGHGPIGYTVELYRPGHELRCRFTAPRGIDGVHSFVVSAGPRPGTSVLEHALLAETSGWARLTWPLVFRPLHDALIEDALAKAIRTVGGLAPSRSAWTPWVRLIRWVARSRDVTRPRPASAGSRVSGGRAER